MPVPPTERVALVREAVVAHVAHGGVENLAQAAVLDALDNLAAPFDREGDSTHLTASAIVVGEQGTLLHLHRREKHWLQPGGHIDPDEFPWQTAVRETAEETGVCGLHPSGVPQLLSLDKHPTSAGHVHLDLRYLLLAESAEITPGEGESPDVRWFSWEDALNLTAEDPQLHASLELALAVWDSGVLA